MMALVAEYTVFVKPVLLRGKHTHMRTGETYVYDFVRVEGCTRYG
jgi:hypothetical protein